ADDVRLRRLNHFDRTVEDRFDLGLRQMREQYGRLVEIAAPEVPSVRRPHYLEPVVRPDEESPQSEATARQVDRAAPPFVWNNDAKRFAESGVAAHRPPPEDRFDLLVL